MNTVNLIGNICNDLEIKATSSGKSVVQFNLAVSRPFAKDTTDFIPLVVWNQTAEFLCKYARKGSKIAVTGKLTSRKWQDANGNNRVSYEVVCDTAELLNSKQEGDSETNDTTLSQNAAQQGFSALAGYMPDAYKPSATAADFEPVDDASLPF